MATNGYEYKRMFTVTKEGDSIAYNRGGPADRIADRVAKPVYEFFNPDIELTVNVALATSRPLLVRGPAGSGKTSLAATIAHNLGWRYYEKVVTSATRAQDLLWTYDSIRRLSDAQVKRDQPGDLPPASHYVKPGVLWWAFDRKSARKREPTEPFSPQPNNPCAVILIDEIDKADPDVPNSLLAPLGSLTFHVDEADEEVSASKEHPPLIVLTTNDERGLPAAFLRRCVVLELKSPTEDDLVRIATRHFGGDFSDLYLPVARKVVEATKPEPSTAEYLDAVWACISLHVRPPAQGQPVTKEWEAIAEATLMKPAEPRIAPR
jgi:MoxR-like ATPase